MEYAQTARRPTASFNQNKIVSSCFARYQSRSASRAEQNITIPRGSIQILLRNKLHMSLYKIQAVEQLEDSDHIACTGLATRVR